MPLISQSEGSRISRMSRQGINNIKKRGKYKFFVNGKIDTEHSDWKIFLSDRVDGFPGQDKSSKQVSKTDNGIHSDIIDDKKKDINKEPDEPGIKYNKEHSLTGGYNPEDPAFKPDSPQQLKAMTEVVSKNLDMRIKLGELIRRDVVDLYIGKISREVNQFVYLGRSISKEACEKLDRIGMEKEIEKIINKEVEIIIERIIQVCNNAKK